MGGHSRWAKSFHPPQHPHNRILIAVVVLLFVVTRSTQAQVTTSITPTTGTGNLNTAVTQSGNVYNITDGTRAGTNLFHSFGNFSVGSGDIANFLNNTQLPTTNILSRVTGGNVSNIYGTIQTTDFGNANLFLMNPAGIIFGPNATLNVGGSVAFTTANYLKLMEPDGSNAGSFHADPLSSSALTSAPITSFGFLSSNSGSITVQGSQLSVSDGMNISLVGGNVTIQSGAPDMGVTQPARLSAPNGLIRLASAASPGDFDATTLQPLANVDGTLFPSSGSITLAPGSHINVSGTNNVSIRDGQFVLSVNDAVLITAESAGPLETISLSPGSSIISSNQGAAPGADVQIIAGNLQLDGASIQSLTTGDGPGGNISIGVNTVGLTNGAQVVSSTSGTGTGGDINVAATGIVSISGFDATGSLTGVTNVLVVDLNTGLPAVTSGIYSLTLSSGNGGQIHLSAPTASVVIQSGGTIATIASGDGSGGSITVDSNTLTMTDGGQIASFTGADLALGELTGGIGIGGNVTVSAQESLTIGGYSTDLALSSSVSTQTFGAGKGGNIATSAPTTNLENGGQLAASSFTGEAPTGNISVSAPDNLLISGSNPFGFSQIHTDTGSISIAAGSVTLTDQAFVSSGGNIDFQVQNDLNVTAGGSITSNGGAIGVTADQAVISGEGPFGRSQILSLASGETAAGDITLDVRDLRITDRGLIRSESTGAGQNAAVTVNAESVIIANLGEISMLNSQGPGGLLEIRSSNITLNQGVLSTTASGAGDAGAISLVGDNITFSNSRISSATNGGTARGGDVTVTATNSFTITGLFTDDSGLTSPSGILTRTFTEGNAGDVTVTAGNILISSGGQINSSSLSSGHAGSITIEGTQSPAQSVLIDGLGSGIFTDTQGTGAGGNIFINANTVTLQNGGTLSARTSGTEATATGGSITVAAPDQVIMRGNSSITASSTGPADAGNIFINAGRQLDMRDSSITTTAAQASGGNIDIQAVDRVSLANSTISTSVLGGSGSGGNITIDPTLISLANSNILAQAILGSGGNIRLVAGLLLVDPTSVISASSEFGQSGTIQSPTSNLAGSVGSLPSSTRQGQALQAQRCALLNGGEASSFLIAGRDQVPTEPDGWLVSSLAPLSAGTGQEARGEGDGRLSGLSSLSSLSGSVRTGILSHQIDQIDEPPILSLRRLTPAGFLTQHFTESETSGCRS